MSESAVLIQAVIADADGATRFVDRRDPYLPGRTPLHMTAAGPAKALRFREWPAGDWSAMQPVADRRLVLVMSGGLEVRVSNGETRVFRAGDALLLEDAHGEGHATRAVDGAAARSAVLNLDKIGEGAREADAGDRPAAIEYVHNQETADGVSYFERKRMPFISRAGAGWETAPLSLDGHQFVFAGADLDYAWHPAPQRQVVLVLTGGLAMEYGDDSHAEVAPGGFLIGEDTDGKGHITRALDGRPRFSVFAHLKYASRFPADGNVNP